MALLAGCGGGSIETPPPRIAAAAFPEGAVPFAEGAIGNACLVHRRTGATRSRCGCIQAAADLTLSQSEQQRGTAYFSDPGQLQDVRQSDSPANERFWQAWTRFAETAEALCTGA